MGLLDFQDDVDDFAFSNFDGSFTPASTTSSTPVQTPETPETPKKDEANSYFPVSSSNSPFAGASMESVSTNASSSSTSSSPSKSRKSRSLVPPPPRRNRSKSFDVFGEDEELQAAEPTIRFCDICLKDCHTHR